MTNYINKKKMDLWLTFNHGWIFINITHSNNIVIDSFTQYYKYLYYIFFVYIIYLYLYLLFYISTVIKVSMLTADFFRQLLRQMLDLTVAGSHLQESEVSVKQSGAIRLPLGRPAVRLRLSVEVAARVAAQVAIKGERRSRRCSDATTISDAAWASARAAYVSLLNYNY